MNPQDSDFLVKGINFNKSRDPFDFPMVAAAVISCTTSCFLTEAYIRTYGEPESPRRKTVKCRVIEPKQLEQK